MNEYSVPLTSPPTAHVSTSVVHMPPPGLLNTRYSSTGAPLSAPDCQDKVTFPSPTWAPSAVGGSGRVEAGTTLTCTCTQSPAPTRFTARTRNS